MDNYLIRISEKTKLFVSVGQLVHVVKTVIRSVEHASFFEARATEYSRAATGGDWGDVFG